MPPLVERPIGLSLVLVGRQLAKLPGATPIYRRGLLVAAFVAMIVCPMGTFGQREHLMIVLALPYLLLFAVRVSGGDAERPTAIALAALAAIGFALKPHFLVVPVALELYRLARSRALGGAVRPETLTLAAVILAYLASIALFTPAYLERIVPYALLVYDDAFMQPLGIVLRRAETVLLPLVIGLHLAIRKRQQVGATDVFAIGAAGFYAAYVVQLKGWSYHVVPAEALMVLTVASMLLTDPARLAKHWRRFAMLPAAAVTLATLVSLPISRGTYRNPVMEDLLPIVRTHAAGGAIYAFSSNVSVGFPLANVAGVEWASRFSTQWLLPGVMRRLAEPERLNAASLARVREIERYAVDAVIEDLALGAPTLVLVDVRRRKSYFGDLDFDYLTYFAGQPGFTDIWLSFD